MKNIICVICEDEFDPYSPAKIKAGGKFNHCADCAHEDVVKYFAVSEGEGKQGQIEIYQTNNEEDKQRYIEFRKVNSGFYRGKNCQLGNHLKTDPGIKFKTRKSFSPTNHKGKA